MTDALSDGARRLNDYLENHRITATELAQRCGMSRSQLCHLSSGRRAPTLDQAIELRNRARIPVDAWSAVGP